MMFIILHEVKNGNLNEVLINTDLIEHIKSSDTGRDTYVRMVRHAEMGTFFFVKETVKEIFKLMAERAYAKIN